MWHISCICDIIEILLYKKFQLINLIYRYWSLIIQSGLKATRENKFCGINNYNILYIKELCIYSYCNRKYIIRIKDVSHD